MKITIFKHIAPRPKDKAEAASTNWQGETVQPESKRHFLDLIKKYVWSPFVFKRGYRKADDFQETSLIVADVDNNLPLPAASEQVKLLGYTCIVGTTLNHQKEKDGIVADRYRLIFPLSAPIIQPNQYAATWKALMNVFKELDPSCKDLARFYFPCSEAAIYQGHRRFPILDAEYTVVEEKEDSYIPEAGERGALSRRTQAFLEAGAHQGQRHHEMVLALFDLKGQNYTEKEAYDIIKPVMAKLKPEENVAKQVRDIYRNRGFKFDFRRQK